MATAAAPALHFSFAPRRALALAPASGATTATSFGRMSVKVLHARTWPSHVSGRRPLVSADYSDRRGGGAGDFVAGFLLGGAIFGALGYILAPQISKSLEEGGSVKDGGTAAKRPSRYLEDDEGLEHVALPRYTHAVLNGRVGRCERWPNVVSDMGESIDDKKTRQTLNEKIAQLNAAIDDVSAQLRTEEGLSIPNDNK